MTKYIRKAIKDLKIEISKINDLENSAVNYITTQEKSVIRLKTIGLIVSITNILGYLPNLRNDKEKELRKLERKIKR